MPHSRRDIAREVEARKKRHEERAEQRRAEGQVDFSKLQGKEYKSFEQLKSEYGIADDPRDVKPIKKASDWYETTKLYVANLKKAVSQLITAKNAMAPAGEYPVHNVMRKFLAFGKYEYEKMVKTSTEVGLSPEEKMMKLGKTPEQLNQEIAAAEKVLQEVGAAFQNDIIEVLPDLEAEKDDLTQKLAKAQEALEATEANPDPTGEKAIHNLVGSVPDDPSKKIKPEIMAQWRDIRSTPKPEDRSNTINKLQADLSSVQDRITRIHNGVQTVQKIVAGDPQSIGADRFGKDPQAARFFALCWFIANRNLVAIKLGVQKNRNERGRINTQAPTPHSPVPDRPSSFPKPEIEPPSEAYKRFAEILEGIGGIAAIKYATLVKMPLNESLPLLKSAYLELRNLTGAESFLNNRHCHLVEMRDDGLIVQLVDEDIHKDDRMIRISFNEAALIDGSMKRA